MLTSRLTTTSSPSAEHVRQGLGLDDVARDTVQHETTRRRPAFQEVLAQDINDDIVGYQVSPFHVALHDVPEVGAISHGGPEGFPGRNVGHAVQRRQALRLGALA